MNVGGAETMLMNIYRQLDRAMLQFDFLVFTAEGAFFDQEIRRLGGRIFRVPAPKRAGVTASALGLSRVIKSEGPFLAVHSHILNATGWVMLVARVAGVRKRIAHSHNTADIPGGPLRRAYEALSRLAIRGLSTDWVACGSDAGQYLFGATFGTRGVILRNAVDAERFATVSRRKVDRLRAGLGIAPGTMVLGSIARIEPVKNHRFMLRLAHRAREVGLDVRLLLIGTGSCDLSMRRLAEDLGLEDVATFLGVRSDIPELMHLFDFFLMPSHFEGLPVTLVEAQSSGTPCLVSDRITLEVDLGLGLVHFLSTESMEPWVQALVDVRSSVLSEGRIRAALINRGYDINHTIDDVYSLYGLASE